MSAPELRTHSALVVVVLVAAGLRFISLSARGLIVHDEASMCNTVKGAVVATEVVAARAAGRTQDLRESLKSRFQEEGFPNANTAGKMGYALCLYPFLLAFGISDFAALLPAALLGTLTVIVVYFLGGRVWQPGVGLVGALVCACSPLHVFYSRSAISHVPAGFFLVLGLLLLLKAEASGWERRWTVLAGAAIGFAATCHYLLLWALPLAFAWAAWNKAGAKRLAALGIGLVSPALALQLGSFAMVAAFGSLIPDQLTYFGELMRQVSVAGDPYYSMYQSSPTFYVEMLGKAGDWLLLAGWIPVVFWLVRGFKSGRGLLAAAVICPVVLFTLSPIRVGRGLALIAPLLALAGAAGVFELGMRLRRPAHRLALALVASALLGLGGLKSPDILGVRTPYPALVAAAVRQGGYTVLGDGIAVMEFYAKRGFPRDLPDAPGRYCLVVESPEKFRLVDMSAHRTARAWSLLDEPDLRELLRLEDPNIGTPFFGVDTGHGFHVLRRLRETEAGREIRVYELPQRK